MQDSGSAMNFFSIHSTSLFMIKIPETLEEQKKIAAVLTAQDKQIDLLKKQKAALEQQKKGLCKSC